MSLFKRLKKKKDTRVSNSKDSLVQRKQLNVLISPRNFEQIKRLSVDFNVRKFVIVEHVLDVGCHYLTKAAENPEKRDNIHTHLVKEHALHVKTIGDPEEILRSGEGDYQPELVKRIEAMENAFAKLGKATTYAATTKNDVPMKLAEKRFQDAAFNLVVWTYDHPLEKT